ncbi:hypothetical protein JTE90_009989 [Oedothorax gibbosus]|uniref:Peptidase S1 domain-containing protein n=1 Tax=Oedothorax gibbosus TaxID=931172 RepID=A0AAV6UH65_9ARAC|nr:hypothetical protein JTE90_009989 [Oedothorax gibbosus]
MGVLLHSSVLVLFWFVGFTWSQPTSTTTVTTDTEVFFNGTHGTTTEDGANTTITVKTTVIEETTVSGQTTVVEKTTVTGQTTVTVETTIAEETTTVIPVTNSTDFTRSPKSATVAETPVLLSLPLQAAVPKRQCGRRFARNARIVGGGDTYEGEFPWAVSVRLLTTHYCGGAIITKYWILTAAHCVKRYSARYFRIRVGEKDISKDGFRPDVDIHVDEVSVHPGFGRPRRYSNDLALLRLKRPLSFDAYAQPICLPDPEQSLEGRNATAVGWGWMNEIQKVKPDVLQKVQVPILNNSVCAKWYADVYNGYVQIYDYQICAGFKEGKKDSCQGDSGGPLVLKDGDHFSIIGVVSAGVGCGREKLPGIYSRVSLFVPWIRQVTGLQV